MKNIILKHKAKLSGRFKLIATNAVTGETRLLADWFDNLILDQGLEYPGTNNNYCGYCHIGTGSVPAEKIDSALNSFDSSQSLTSSSVNAQASAPYFGSKIFYYRFDPAGANINISEVGVGIQATTGGLFSRVVLPSTVSILAGEILDVYYELRLYPAHLSTTSTTFTIGAVTHDIDILACEVTNTARWANGLGDVFEYINLALWGAYDSTAALGPVTSVPSGVNLGVPTSVGVAAYSGLSLARQMTVMFGIDKANDPSGIGAIVFGGDAGSYQVLFDPPILKTNGLELRITMRFSWSRQ